MIKLIAKLLGYKVDSTQRCHMIRIASKPETTLYYYFTPPDARRMKFGLSKDDSNPFNKYICLDLGWRSFTYYWHNPNPSEQEVVRYYNQIQERKKAVNETPIVQSKPQLRVIKGGKR